MSKIGMTMMLANRNRSNRGGDRDGRTNNETQNNYGMGSNQDSRMRGGYDMESNYEMDSRFRDRRGREHYDNGRFAPMRSEMQSNRWLPPYYDVDINRYEYELEQPESRGGRMIMGGYDFDSRSRRDQGRERYDNGRYAPSNNYGGDRMRMIGFDRPENEMRMVGSDASMPKYQEMDRMHGGHAQSGGARFQRQPHFDEQMAMEWTNRMENADGTTGPHWSLEQIEKVMREKKINLDPIQFFAAVNMIYSDYVEVAKKRNLNSMDFYADMAKAFLHDKDAGAEDKLAAYYEYVVKG